MSELKLADLGEGMHEAEIVEWLVKEGDTVKLDQTVVKVETDKAIVEIPSPVSGRVSQIRVQPGETAKVGDVLVVFDSPVGKGSTAATDGTQFIASTPPASSTTSVPTPSTPSAPTPPTISPPTPSTTSAITPSTTSAVPSTSGTTPRRRALAAPAVRKLAFELGVDIDQVPPSNPNSRVSLEDVRAYAEQMKQPAPAAIGTQPATPSPIGAQPETPVSTTQPAPVGTQFIASTSSTPTAQLQDERQPLTGLRKRIAEHMERSWRTIPHATAFDEVDGLALKALRESIKPFAEKRGIRLTYIPLLIKLLIPLLKEFPIFNASLDEQSREIIYKRSYHIGIATATPEGLLVPVLRNADHMTLLEIASNVERLIEGAKKRSLPLSEVSGSTFTLNNVGSFGGSSGTPIINHPEVAILAVGRLSDKPIIQHSEIVIRPIMPLALSFDHRLIDGAMAGAFLARFKDLVENPQQILLDL
ncbi:MAG TPA: dihydrolipoamide acetyltransferase family protein [Ktedonobacteraceae bacterium]|jgi:pyruvate dehydrogenase E2 component (dihydrolipoamide acetyltransferase)|nr:dihydrolipoamide acetyltransferase family protein [Ktedonobacteraceae bacterium]